MKFNEKVWQITRSVPKGRVTTYREIAHALNCKAYRAVGNALNKNPDAPKTPCHRVVNSDGRVGGFAFEPELKLKRLNSEGIKIKNGKIVDFENKFFKLI